MVLGWGRCNDQTRASFAGGGKSAESMRKWRPSHEGQCMVLQHKLGRAGSDGKSRGCVFFEFWGSGSELSDDDWTVLGCVLKMRVMKFFQIPHFYESWQTLFPPFFEAAQETMR